MIFRKKKKMIDIRELQKKGAIRIPKKPTNLPANNNGFLELNTNKNPPTNNNQTQSSDLFNFANTSPQTEQSSDTYTKRETDAKIIELDNKIYKLEQRIELLEKKLNINQNLGPMGW